MSDLDGYAGTQDATSANDEYGAATFVIRAILAARHHVDLCRVVAVATAGGLTLAGTVDVQPLVNQLDADGNAVAHGIVNGLPYARMQGGVSAIIMDPAEGDIGLCLFADRDISSVVATSDLANPGSARRSSMSDGVYLGGLLNAIPTQYVMLDATGINIVSPTKITMQAPEIDLTAPVIAMNASTSTTVTTPTFTVNGASQFNGAVSATGTVHGDGDITNGGNLHTTGTITGDTDVKTGLITLKTHRTSGVTPGILISGPPIV
jgi:hypothetical protein